MGRGGSDADAPGRVCGNHRLPQLSRPCNCISDPSLDDPYGRTPTRGWGPLDGNPEYGKGFWYPRDKWSGTVVCRCACVYAEATDGLVIHLQQSTLIAARGALLRL